MLIHNFSLTTSIEHVKVDWATITEYKLELQTKVREDFKITISWLTAPTSALSARFKNLYDTMLNSIFLDQSENGGTEEPFRAP